MLEFAKVAERVPEATPPPVAAPDATDATESSTECPPPAETCSVRGFGDGVSFWFEGPVNAPEDLVLTRDRLRFSGWDAAAEFFMSSPVQRALSRAVYDYDYRSSIRDMRSDGEDAMLAGHARVVDATVKSLEPLVEELRRRRALVGAALEL